jgi:acetyl-CoA synthase
MSSKTGLLEQAIKGAAKIIDQAQDQINQAIAELGEDSTVGFPGTAYNLPIYHGITGKTVGRLTDLKVILNELKLNLKQENSIENATSAGIASIIAIEILEAAKYAGNRMPYNPPYTGFVPDSTLRGLGVRLVNGDIPGISVIAGTAPTLEAARTICQEAQKRGLLSLLSGPITEQASRANLTIGLDSLLIPLGPELNSIEHAANLAVRVALTFGAVKPGDKDAIVSYVKSKVPAFIVVLGPLDGPTISIGLGATALGLTIVTDQPSAEPLGINVEQNPSEIIAKACEVRGIKTHLIEVPIPTGFSRAFEGKRIRKEQMYVEFGGGKTPYFELLQITEPKDVEDGKVSVIGPEIDSMEGGKAYPLGILIEVAGESIEKTFEPMLERRIHEIINYGEETWHIAQRDKGWVRISKEGFKKGFKIHHFGTMIQNVLKSDYPSLVKKIQVTIFTEEDKVRKMLEKAQITYSSRDAKVTYLSDEDVNKFYSCILCQSFAPNHVCVITPERDGLCGTVTYIDAATGHKIRGGAGANQPIPKGKAINEDRGEWEDVDKFVREASHGETERVSLYSLMIYPTTSCGCFECISIYLPECHGLVIVSREFKEETPVGMRFSTLAGIIGGQTPGILGHSKKWIVSKKFFRADGGIKRIVWMPSDLKDQLRDDLRRRCQEEGAPDLYDNIADENHARKLEDLLDWLKRVNHPVLNMPPLEH